MSGRGRNSRYRRYFMSLPPDASAELQPNRPDATDSARALEPYLRLGLATIPRCLGQLDRRPSSPTFGCADVYYWRYRLHDVRNARLQEMAWLLALAYRHPLPGGERYHGNPNFRAWSLGTAVFWARQQHQDGSVAEVYPFERSFCAGAFSTYAMTEVWDLLQLDRDSTDDVQEVHAGIERAATWLAGHEKLALSNQMAAAVVALWNADRIVPGRGFRGAAEDKLATMLARQTPDGGFPEYGGTDYGYQSITLSVLSHLATKDSCPGLVSALERGGALLDGVVDERGLYDYSATSRQTQYLYPAGLVRLDLAAARRHLEGLRQDVVINPLWMDDRYCIPLATDYLLAYLHGAEEARLCS